MCGDISLFILCGSCIFFFESAVHTKEASCAVCHVCSCFVIVLITLCVCDCGPFEVALYLKGAYQTTRCTELSI